MTTYNIYFDPTHDDSNLGWSVSNPENDRGVTVRFTNHKDAINYCTSNGFEYNLQVEGCYD
jgi:hypothetical protein